MLYGVSCALSMMAGAIEVASSPDAVPIPMYLRPRSRRKSQQFLPRFVVRWMRRIPLSSNLPKRRSSITALKTVVCMPLVIAGGALALGAYLAIKGTCLAARGPVMLGREAYGAVKRHQEEKRQRQLAELEAELAVQEQALQTQQQLVAGPIQAVEQRLALSRISHQVESAGAARAAPGSRPPRPRRSSSTHTLT
jgi:hypothetical protein